MGENSKIEWCDHTFNPWVGCTKVSPGCDACYAEGWARRTGQSQLWQGQRRRTTVKNWQEPLTWNCKAAEAGTRAFVFCASLADWLDNQVPDEWRSDLFDLIEATPYLDWLMLTKRPQNATSMIDTRWRPANVMFGVTVENQTEADRRRPHVEALAAAGWRVFVSYEPALGPVDWTGWEFISWLISGGESGPKARPSHPDWHRAARDFCGAHGVAYFLKQWGEWIPLARVDASDDGFWPTASRSCIRLSVDGGRADHGWPMQRVGKARAGRLLDGREHNDFPGAGVRNLGRSPRLCGGAGMSAPASTRPIIFSAPMVRALLNGHKTQTRRALKPQPDTSKISAPFHPEHRGSRCWVFMARDDVPSYAFAAGDFHVSCAPGDALWVRETWAPVDDSEWGEGQWIDYRATPKYPDESTMRAAAWDNDPDSPDAIRWRSPIHMPRRASRLTLRVTQVRVQRLQDISEEDAIEEGAADWSRLLSWNVAGVEETPSETARRLDWARREFATMWDSINGKRPGTAWSDNPYVAAISFDVLRQNIDDVLLDIANGPTCEKVG